MFGKPFFKEIVIIMPYFKANFESSCINNNNYYYLLNLCLTNSNRLKIIKLITKIKYFIANYNLIIIKFYYNKLK